MKSNPVSITTTGKGEPIILLHGWGMNSSVFEPLVIELEQNREVLNVDLPGYGASNWSSSLSFEDQAELLAEQLPEADLLGWSMGGLFAMEMLRQKPNKFRSLILVCCNPCFVRRSDWCCAVEESVFNAFSEDLNQNWKATIKRFLTLQMMGDNHTRQSLREVMTRLQIAGEPNLQALKFGLELLKQNDSRALLASLDLPVKLILGARDTLVPNSLVKEIVKVNPKIQVESLATAAHAPFLSHTAQFSALI